MDSIIQRNINELISELKTAGTNLNDPVSKLMVTALLHEAQKIKDEIIAIPERVASRLSDYFIPKNKIGPVPALCLLQPTVRLRKGQEGDNIQNDTFFTFKIDNKVNLTYYPLFRNFILPTTSKHILTDKILLSGDSMTKLNLKCKGKVWLGLEIPVETDSLENVSFYIRNTSGVMPQKIFVGHDMVELSFTPSNNLTDIPMMAPFDSQQAGATSIEIFSSWQRYLANTDDGLLLYINDALKDRDIFKYRGYPKSFRQYLESNDLDRFANNTLWLLFDFGDEYDVPSDIEIMPNVVPAVNVSLNSVTLTQSSPMAKLTKGDGTYFLNIVETSLSSQKQGFNMVNEDIVIRDFDASCYNKDILYRDVRNLYNRFIEDYHAFVEFHSLKDGELVRTLRDLINKIGKGVETDTESRPHFDEDTYVMRSVGMSGKSAIIKVSYLTTNGRLGNSPKAGMLMENKKDLNLEKDVMVVAAAQGGENKADTDQRYEMLRYYTLTADRLFTKMDIDAFLRLQLLKEFGKDEIKRISHNITIQGAGGESKLVRGLYIDIEFKDEKNYLKAQSLALDNKLRKLIVDRSCISMPVIVTLVNDDLK